MAITLLKYKGCLALLGSGIDQLAVEALNSPNFRPENCPPNPHAYHITLVSKDELRTLAREKTDKIKLDVRHIFSLGIGGKVQAGIYWVVIIWAAGQQIRKQLGLPPKHFHITLSSNDVHNVDKGIKSRLSPPALGSIGGDVLDHLIFTLQAFGAYTEAKLYAVELASQDASSHKGFVRLADAAFSVKEFKLAMLSYACGWERIDDSKARSYCLKKLIECSRETEWGHVFQEQELDAVSQPLVSTLLKPWSTELRYTLSNQECSPTFLLEARQSLFVPQARNAGFYKLPRFFRWLVPYHLAIMSTPRNEDDLTALSSPHLAIRHVLTLTEETPLPGSWFRTNKVTNTFLPIPNYFPPTVEQMDLIMRLFDDPRKLPLLVHCGGGKGRAGTVAACYLAACGFGKPSLEQDHPKLSAEEAVTALRSIRPGSLETSQQEAFVSVWCSTIWKRKSIYPDIPCEPPPCSLEVEGTFKAESADFYVLVGLPGSGKTWFSRSLVARDQQSWIHISQDDTGSRASCEVAVGRMPRKSQRILLDRCNTSADDRKTWIKLASNWCVSPVCIWFDYGAALCTARAQMRACHPTLTPGGRVRNAVKQMEAGFVKPTLQEGWKAILIVRSFGAAREAVLRLSSPLTIFKFPRTPHLIDTGSATEDDIHTDLNAFTSFIPTCESQACFRSRVTITEKIDGANMGLSLSSSRDRIVVQNRSHYVNARSHEQFKKLDTWLARHDDDLRQILDRDPYFAERYTLFGEWVYATHAISYSDLPDWFMAYDLYDRSRNSFVDRQGLEAFLDGTSIQMAPVLFGGDKMPTKEDLLAMIQRRSMFYNGRVEGVYVKIEEGGYVKLRGKVVRSDFIAGNEHWSRGNIRENKLAVVQSGN